MICLLGVLLLGCTVGRGKVGQVTPTPTKTPRPLFTATWTPTITALPSATPSPTNTTVPTAEPSETPVLPTDTPVPPTDTPAPATDTQAPTAGPTNTPKPAVTRTPAPPTNTPAPKLDFRVVEQRLISKAENRGLHSFFIRVIDATGNPLHGLTIWDRTHPDGPQPITGSKPDPYSAEYQFWNYDDYYLEVKDSKSEKTKALSSDRSKISNQDLIAAGYCVDNQDCDQNIHAMDFAWFVTFQRTW
jgi:hypothetical protein